MRALAFIVPVAVGLVGAGALLSASPALSQAKTRQHAVEGAKEKSAQKLEKSQARQQSALVKRGKYLVTISGCEDCHTPGTFYGAPDMSRELSGSELGWAGPWGETFAANLTPDKETGLGKWTDDQVANAIRHGIRPDKSVLKPPMPWQDLSVMTDADVNAVVAYLRSIKPVHHVVPAAVPPGAPLQGKYVQFPMPPPAWDAPKNQTGTGSGAAPKAP